MKSLTPKKPIMFSKQFNSPEQKIFFDFFFDNFVSNKNCMNRLMGPIGTVWTLRKYVLSPQNRVEPLPLFDFHSRLNPVFPEFFWILWLIPIRMGSGWMRVACGGSLGLPHAPKLEFPIVCLFAWLSQTENGKEEGKGRVERERKTRDREEKWRVGG